MQKVIGLDIGSYSIKAVEITNTFKSYEITNFYENVIPNIEEVDTEILIPACLEQLFKENNLKADRIITAMPGQYVSSRIIPLGFSDPRKIEATILSEVEDSVPFNMEDMVFDHQVLGQYGDKTMTMIVMTKKIFLKSFLEHLQRVHIDPKLVDIDSLSFYNLSPYIAAEPGECIAMVDMGHEKTSVCLVQDGVLRMFRSINLGGRYISEFLARDLEITFSEAQRTKHAVSQVLCDDETSNSASADDKLVAERMTLAVNGIVKELGRTIYAYRMWDKNSKISRIFLSGGTSKIKNIDKYLFDQLEIPTVLNRLDQTNLKIAPELDSNMASMVQGIAIGMRAVLTVKKNSQINLRKGEFAYVQNYEQILRWGGLITRLVTVTMLVLILSYTVKRIFYAGQIADLEKQFVKEYSAIIPVAKKKSNTNVNFLKFRTEVNAQLQKDIEIRRQAVEEFIEQNSSSQALGALYSISESISKSVKIDVTEYNFVQTSSGHEGKIVIKGETDAYAQFSSILEALKKSKGFSDVVEKRVGGKPGTDNKVIEFELNMNAKKLSQK